MFVGASGGNPGELGDGDDGQRKPLITVVIAVTCIAVVLVPAFPWFGTAKLHAL